MGAILDKITEFIKEILQGWVMDNLTTMFTDVNDKVGTIAGEVGRTPSSWNSGVFSIYREPFGKCDDTHSGHDHQCDTLL